MIIYKGTNKSNKKKLFETQSLQHVTRILIFLEYYGNVTIYKRNSKEFHKGSHMQCISSTSISVEI